MHAASSCQVQLDLSTRQQSLLQLKRNVHHAEFEIEKINSDFRHLREKKLVINEIDFSTKKNSFKDNAAVAISPTDIFATLKCIRPIHLMTHIVTTKISSATQESCSKKVDAQEKKVPLPPPPAPTPEISTSIFTEPRNQAENLGVNQPEEDVKSTPQTDSEVDKLPSPVNIRNDLEQLFAKRKRDSDEEDLPKPSTSSTKIENISEKVAEKPFIGNKQPITLVNPLMDSVEEVQDDLTTLSFNKTTPPSSNSAIKNDLEKLFAKKKDKEVEVQSPIAEVPAFAEPLPRRRTITQNSEMADGKAPEIPKRDNDGKKKETPDPVKIPPVPATRSTPEAPVAPRRSIPTTPAMVERESNVAIEEKPEDVAKEVAPTINSNRSLEKIHEKVSVKHLEKVSEKVLETVPDKVAGKDPENVPITLAEPKELEPKKNEKPEKGVPEPLTVKPSQKTNPEPVQKRDGPKKQPLSEDFIDPLSEMLNDSVVPATPIETKEEKEKMESKNSRTTRKIGRAKKPVARRVFESSDSE